MFSILLELDFLPSYFSFYLQRKGFSLFLLYVWLFNKTKTQVFAFRKFIDSFPYRTVIEILHGNTDTKQFYRHILIQNTYHFFRLLICAFI